MIQSINILTSCSILPEKIIANTATALWATWWFRSWMNQLLKWFGSITITPLLQFFSIVYTQILVLETQWPQHVTHSPTPWTNSAKLQAQFLLYTQIAVLKHFFQNTTHNSLLLAQFSCRKYLVFTRNTLPFKYAHWLITRANTHHTVLQLAIRALA